MLSSAPFRHGRVLPMPLGAQVLKKVAVGGVLRLPSAILFAAGLLSPVLHAEPCSDFRPAPGNLGYGPRGSREHGDFRCEGMYIVPAAGEPIEVVSYLRTRGPLPDRSPGLVLEVVPPDVGLEYRGKSVSIVALARDPGVFYRMSAEIPIERRLRWPVEEVLEPVGLYPAGFGLLAWVETAERHRLFLPVTLQIEGTSLAAPPPGDASLFIRPCLYLAQLDWRARPRQVANPPPWQTLGAVPAGQTVRLRLPRATVAERHVVVDVSSQTTDGRWLETVPVHVMLP
jgi:hypothetical protein